MDDSLIVGLILALTGALAGAIGKIVYDMWSKRDPITRGQAEVALAQSAVATAGVVNSSLGDEVARLGGRREHVESRLSAVERLSGSALRYIDTLLRWISGGQRGPMPAPEDELHPHIDPGLHAAWRQPHQDPDTTT